MKLYQITMEPLEKRLEACIGEIKSLICSPSTDLVNSSVSPSSKVANRLLGTIYADDTHNDIDWKALLLKLYEELRKTEEKDEDNEAEENKDEYSFTLDSIGTLIVMMKDQLKKCLQSKPTATDDNLTVDPSLRNYKSISSRNTNVPNYITLTQNNVEVNEIWETLIHSLKDLIIDQLVATNIDNPLQKEAFYHEMILLNSLISSSEESELFSVYNSIRSQRIEKQLSLDHVDCFNLETIVDYIKKWVNFDLELVDYYHLFYNQVTFHQIVTPYIILVKNLIIEGSPKKQSHNEPEKILKMINLLRDLDSFLSERDTHIPSENMSPSKDIHDIWDWRGYFVSQGVDNLLLRYLNQGLNDLMSSTASFNTKPETGQLTSINQSDNVLLTINQIFKFLDSFESIELAEFKTSSKVIVNVTIVDFLIKTSEIWLKESTLPIESYYTLYNSFLYSQRKLDHHGLSNGKIDDVINSLRSKIVSSHLSLLLFSYKSLDYIIIYMKKLSITMLNLIPYETQDESHIFINILTLYMAHIVKINIELSDCLILSYNLIDLLMPFAVNVETLFYKNFRDIHSCCWLLLVRAIFFYAPISILNQELSLGLDNSTNNKETIKPVASSKFSSPTKPKFKSTSNSTTSPLSTPSSRHWTNLFDLYIETIPRPSNAYLISLQRKRPAWSALIRPFLESRLSFSINVFNHLEVTPENEEKVIAFLSNIITVSCLNESREKSVSYLLFPIIQRNEEWRWLDITKITARPKPWWYQALHKVIDETVFKFVQAALIPLAYRFLLQVSKYKSYYDEAGLNERYAEYDETFLIDEATKSLLSTIPTIMEILPLPLIASLEDLKNIKMITVKTLYNSLTAQIIFGSILNCLTRPISINQTLTQIGEAFTSKVADKLEKMVITEGKWPSMIKIVSSIVERRLSSKTNYVIASEADQFDLMDTLVNLDPKLQTIVDSLYNFLVSNSSLLVKNGHLTKDQHFNLNFESTGSIQLTYNILEHCETIKTPKISDITDEKWIQLICRVKSKLSLLSIRHIMLEREKTEN